jgi:predicted lipid carrier protein YhbT
LSAPVRYRFEVTERVSIRADIVVEGDKARLEDSGKGSANVTFRCDTETFVLLMYGCLAPAPTITGGRLVVEGDGELAAQFGQWFKGI